MITATAHKQTYKIDRLINRGQWFHNTWLILIPWGFDCHRVIVEASNEQDAIDVLADSKYAHLINCDPCDNCTEGDYDNCTCTLAGNNSHPVNIDDIRMYKCKVNYFAKRDSEAS